MYANLDVFILCYFIGLHVALMFTIRNNSHSPFPPPLNNTPPILQVLSFKDDKTSFNAVFITPYHKNATFEFLA